MSYSHEEQHMLAKYLVTQFIDVAGMDVQGVNEAEKAFVYFRRKGNLEHLFVLSQVRSGNTPFSQTKNTPVYYSQLQKALDTFFMAYPGMEIQDFRAVFGWAIRLAKYCFATSTDIHSLLEQKEELQLIVLSDQRKNTYFSSNQKKASIPNLPTIGDVFGGNVLAIDPQGVRVKIKQIAEDVAIGVIKTSALAGKQYQVNGVARVEVIDTRKLPNGLQIFDLKPVPKKDKH